MACGAKFCSGFCLFKIPTASRSLPEVTGLLRAACQLPCCCQALADKPFALGPLLRRAGRTAGLQALHSHLHRKQSLYSLTALLLFTSAVRTLRPLPSRALGFGSSMCPLMPRACSALCSLPLSVGTAASAGQLGTLHFAPSGLSSLLWLSHIETFSWH